MNIPLAAQYRSSSRKSCPLALKTVMVLAASILVDGLGFAAAADAPGVTATEIFLGATNSLSGPVASACKPTTDGTTAWFNKVNAEGGIGGRKIKYQVLDDAYDGARAVANTRQLMQTPVLAIVGGCGTASAVAVAPLAERNGVPFLMPYATHIDLVKPVKQHVFSGLPLYDSQIGPIVPWIFKRLGPGSVAMVAVQTPGVEDWIAAGRKAAKENGGTFLDPQISQSGQADFTPIVLRLKDQAPDYVIVAVAAGDGARLIETARVQQFAPKRAYTGYSTVANSIFLGPVAPSLEGKMFVTSPTVPDDSPEARECGAAFEKYLPGTPVNSFSLWGCITAQVVSAVLAEIKGPITRDTFEAQLNSLRERKLSPMMPPISFSETNHMAISSVLIFEVKNGKYQVLDRAEMPK